jgi:hypothetical protein
MITKWGDGFFSEANNRKRRKRKIPELGMR